jgi:ABC-type bacteriocin/lantibiotic exporter with double-glycine peptidase domain
LDVAREAKVNAAVQRLELTRIVIAHRPETVDCANKALVLGFEEIKFVDVKRNLSTDADSKTA